MSEREREFGVVRMILEIIYTSIIYKKGWSLEVKMENK